DIIPDYILDQNPDQAYLYEPIEEDIHIRDNQARVDYRETMENPKNISEKSSQNFKSNKSNTKKVVQENKDSQVENNDHVAKLLDRKKIELENMIQVAQNSKKKESKVEAKTDEGLSYGRKMKSDVHNIEDLYDKKGMTVCLVGKVYGLDVFETKSGFFIYTFDLEDKTDVTSCKMFINPKNKPKVADLKNKMGVMVEGVLNYDNY